MDCSDVKASAGARLANFELEAMAEAQNYTAAILGEFAPYLRGTVVEVGAGLGNCTSLLQRHPDIVKLVAIEPDSGLCQQLRARLPGSLVVQGTISSLSTEQRWNAIVSINVLEHIQDDAAELSNCQRLLASGGGCLCLFVPARPELYAPIDRVFGHYRRYAPATLVERVKAAGFDVVHWRYFNGVGYILWAMTFRILRRRSFNRGMIRCFDRYAFPAIHLVESHFWRPPIGQSLLLVARAKG